MTEDHIATAAAVLIPLVLFHFRTWQKLDALRKRLTVEHEILVDDFCKREGIRREDLPTRHNGVLG